MDPLRSRNGVCDDRSIVAGLGSGGCTSVCGPVRCSSFDTLELREELDSLTAGGGVVDLDDVELDRLGQRTALANGHPEHRKKKEGETTRDTGSATRTSGGNDEGNTRCSGGIGGRHARQRRGTRGEKGLLLLLGWLHSLTSPLPVRVF